MDYNRVTFACILTHLDTPVIYRAGKGATRGKKLRKHCALDLAVGDRYHLCYNVTLTGLIPIVYKENA
jgi:hypothetical protein